jgi:hypothetical protein
MSHDAPGPRPRQVTFAGWLIAVSSAVLVVTVFDTMANLHSVDTRDRLTSALTTGSLKDVGISVSDALSLIRAALFVAGVAAVVTGILGVFVLQRHTAARIVLTVAAVPVVLTAPFAGGLLSVLIGGATALLWTREARDWFAGRPPARPVVPAERPPSHRRAPSPESRPDLRPPGPSAASPRPTAGWGSAPEDRSGWAPPAYQPVTSVPAPAPLPPPATSRPRELRIACVVTWVMSALTAAVAVLPLLAVAIDRDGLLDEVRDDAVVRNASLSDTDLVAFVVAASAVVIAWCILAALFALLAWRRVRIGWVLLLVSLVVASFVALFALPYGLVQVAATVVTFVLLLQPAVRRWLEAGRPPTPPGHPPRKPEQPEGLPPVW